MANEERNAAAIRKHLLEFYVTPARQSGHYTVTIKAGEIVKEMEGSPAFPAVCGVLGSDLFEKGARVSRLCIDGPVPGSNTLFVFKL